MTWSVPVREPAAVVHIRAADTTGLSIADVVELWRYRGLLLELVRRDIRVRYAQTVLGATWAVLQPVLSMIVLAIVFGAFAAMPSGPEPYALLVLAGIVPWTYFATVVGSASDSLLAGRELVTKVYFPRLIVPVAPVIAGLVDLAIGLVVLALFAAAWGYLPGWTALLLPLPIAVMLAAAAGIGTIAAALNVQYRDIRYVVPFALQTGLFLSPVIYPIAIVPERFVSLFALNPLTGVIEMTRAIVLGTDALPWQLFLTSAVSSALLLLLGLAYFRRVERLFADVV